MLIMPPWRPLSFIRSGGQTGVDRGALLAAIDRRFPWGGFAPFGWIDEDDEIPQKFRSPTLRPGWGLLEYGNDNKWANAWTKADRYRLRTRANVKRADFTLILVNTDLVPEGESRGSKLTEEICVELHKPHAVINFAEAKQPAIRPLELVIERIKQLRAQSLNVAGHRGSHWANAEFAGWWATMIIIQQVGRR